MNRYTTALAMGIGLLAHSPAVANIDYINFHSAKNAPLSECVKASKYGVALKGGTQAYLVEAVENDMSSSWKLYTIVYREYSTGPRAVACLYHIQMR